MAENTVAWDRDADGIVTLTMDDPTGSANVMNEHYSESMHQAVERLQHVLHQAHEIAHERLRAMARSRHTPQHDHERQVHREPEQMRQSPGMSMGR